MKNYKHILIAVELIDKTDAALIKQGVLMAEKFNADIVLVHAVEHIGGYGAYGMGVGVEVEQALLENAEKSLHSLGRRLNIPEQKLIARIGPAKFVILEEAERLGIDLLVVGSHGRHGIRALLGSTANAVLHGAKCDVLAVRLRE
ncbi:MAG: universal stress protein [Gammaproteobacteria bacterium]|nr:universal stress protein [Gammaproteobacteria bacterium]